MKAIVFEITRLVTAATVVFETNRFGAVVVVLLVLILAGAYVLRQ